MGRRMNVRPRHEGRSLLSLAASLLLAADDVGIGAIVDIREDMHCGQGGLLTDGSVRTPARWEPLRAVPRSSSE